MNEFIDCEEPRDLLSIFMSNQFDRLEPEPLKSRKVLIYEYKNKAYKIIIHQRKDFHSNLIFLDYPQETG